MEELFSMFDAKSALECKNKWNNLMHEIGLSSNMRDVGISSKHDIDIIINNINIQRLNNHPVRVDTKKLKKYFYNSLLQRR
jgi:alcohol dehydrogenase class IV